MKAIFQDMDVKNKRILGFALIVTFLTSILVYWTFNYMDGQSIMAWAVNNWDLLVEGRWGDFYTDKAINLRGAVHTDMTQEGMISPFMYLPTMLWCFPIWVTHYFNGNLFVGTFGCVLWYKLFLLVLTALISYTCYKIVKRLSNDSFKSWIAAIIFAASSEVLLSTGYAGQDEVIYLYFILLAMDAILANKFKLFVLFGTIAVTCTPLAIIPLFAMLILKEKRIWRILCDFVIFFIPTILWSLLSANMADKYVADTLDDQVSRMLDYIYIPVLSGKASVLLIFLVIFYFLCYIKKDISDEEYIWICTLPMVYLCFFTDALFYRSMLYIPFLAILITYRSKNNLELKLLLLTLVQYIRFFALGIDSTQTMNTIYCKSNPILVSLCNALGSQKYDSYDSLVSKIIERVPSLHLLGSTLNGICVACIILMLWVTYSENNESKLQNHKVFGLNTTIVLYVLCMPLYMLIFYGLLLH